MQLCLCASVEDFRSSIAVRVLIARNNVGRGGLSCSQNTAVATQHKQQRGYHCQGWFSIRVRNIEILRDLATGVPRAGRFQPLQTCLGEPQLHTVTWS